MVNAFDFGDFMSFKTYAEINLDNLAHNIGCIREKVYPSALIPIIKANAYGHGAVPVAKRLAREGCAMFAVARFEEAMELRESGITQHILILGRIFPDDIVQAVKAGLIISYFRRAGSELGREGLRRFGDAAQACISSSIREWEE